MRTFAMGWIVVVASACGGGEPATAPVVSILPDATLTGDDLVLSIDTESTDPDGDAITYTTAWFRDGTLVAEYTGDTVPAAATAKGESWHVELTPFSGEETGATGVSAAVVIGDTPPTAATVSIAEAQTGDTLVLTVETESTDADGDTVSYTAEWYRDDALVPEHTGLEVPADATTKGEVWRADVTPVADELAGPVAAAAAITIADTPPSAPGISVADAFTTDDVTVSIDTESTDPDGDALTYRFEWSTDGVIDTSLTTDTVPASATARDENWQVRVIPVADGADGTEATATVVIADTPPTAPSVSVPVSAYTEESLTVTIDTESTDADGDAVTYTYDWFRDGVLDTTHNDATVPASATLKGQIWHAAVTPFANGLAGAPGESLPLTIVDTAPTTPVVSLPPTTTTTEAVSASIDTDSTDVDGDIVSYTFVWLRNGDAVPAYNDMPILPESATAKGETWQVQVTAVADGASSLPATSGALTIVDTPPTRPTVSLVADARTGDDLIVSVDSASTDVDGDSVSYTVVWSKDGVVVPGYTNLTLPSSATRKGETWSATVTPVADGVSGEAAGTTPADILDTPPSEPVVALSPNPATTADDLTAQLQTPSTDADGDSVTYTYRWFRDGNFHSSTSGTLSASSTQVGDSWTVEVTPSADGVNGETGVSEARLVGATNGFFVRTANSYAGDLGALSGADATCLDELVATDWNGKDQAVSDGLLDAAHVQAFLCNTDRCQGPLPQSTYAFAQAGDPSIGGATFTTNAMGQGPDNNLIWSDLTAFGSSADHWTGRQQGGPTLWPMEGDVLNCFNWQTASSELLAGTRIGRAGSTSSSRWGYTQSRCSTQARLVCVVQPVPVEAEPSNCVAPWGEVVPHGDSITAWQDTVGCDDPCQSEERVCDDGALSGTFEAIACEEPTTAVCEDRGYFVVTDGTYTGNLGGLAGADAICLDEVTRLDWMGKADAGVLGADRVEAFLCDDSGCQNPMPSRVYQYANAGAPIYGGGTFLSDTDGAGPGDVTFWTELSRLPTTLTWWSGREAGDPMWWPTTGSDGYMCSGWTTTSGLGRRGSMNRGGPAIGDARWDVSGGAGCSLSYNLVCLVHPEN